MKTYLIPLLAAFLFCTSTCKVDPPVSGITSMAEFHEKYGVPAQTFSFDALNGKTVVTDAGVEIQIPDSAFRDYYGNVLTGELTLVVKEYFKKSEMVLSGMHTVASQGNLLETAGMFHIQVKQGERKLYASNLVKQIVTSILTSAINTGMRAFAAQPGTDPSMSSYGYTSTTSEWWLLYADSIIPGQNGSINYDSIPPQKYILTTGMGYINCDRFYDVPDKTKLTVLVGEDFSVDNIAVYLAFTDINSVTPLYHDYADTTLPLVHISTDIPVNAPVTVVALGIKDGTEYLGVKHTVITENGIETIEMEQTTQAKILAAMRNLDN